MSEWIKCSDQLPSQAGIYLVVADWMGVIEKGEFDGQGQWHIFNHMFDVTHWMPLPKPPEDKDE